jgi:AcrR family transcriptional regulator
MAKLKSPDKRIAILQAAVYEIAESGLGAATAKIASRAGVATGTLFTYFPTKEQLFNELYVELKQEVYRRLNAAFPTKASLETRARYIWWNYLEWAIESPEKRKASVLLGVSDLVNSKSRERTATDRKQIDSTLSELESRQTLRGLPAGFAAALMSAMQEATMEFVGREPRRRAELMERGFQILWRAVR